MLPPVGVQPRTFAAVALAPVVSDLPPLAAAPASAAARLAYVAQHFALAYPAAPPLAALVGQPGSGAALQMPDHSAGFFSQPLPYPPPPHWRDWQQQRLPFFFDPQPEVPLLALDAATKTAVFGADVVSAAFYLLSGWQEYFSEERDAHGRFPYAASVQKQFGFVTVPVVNYYFDILKTALEHHTGQALAPRRWGPEAAPFATCLTHDVDSLHGGWGTAARHALRQRQPGRLLALAAGKALGRPAPWHNLAAVQAATARHGAPGTFFLLLNHRPAPGGPPNADYDFAHPAWPARLAALRQHGAEIALHGSYGTARHAPALAAEAARLRPAPAGQRFHYLSWEPRATPAVVEKAGFAYDTTLGFAEHYGFRNSCCLPFFPWNFAQAQPHTFLEIPLAVMDTTLHHPRYLQLDAAAILPALTPLLTAIKRFGGVFTLLWHNENFDSLNEVNGPQQFHEIAALVQEMGSGFFTCAEIVRQVQTDATQ